MTQFFGYARFSVTLSSFFLLIAVLNAQPTYSNYFKVPVNDHFLIDTTLVYTQAPESQRDPAIAFDGTNFLVVWPDGRTGTFAGTRVTQSGIVLDSAGQIYTGVDSYFERGALTFDGTNYFLAWRNAQTDPGYGDIYGTRISPSGVVLDSSGIPIATDPYSQMLPAVATSPTNYLVVWEDIGICGARVSHSGILIDTAYVVISSSGGHPSAAFDGTNYLVVWQEGYGSSSDICGARISTSGVVLDPVSIQISASQGAQARPNVAFDGTNYLVEWEDDRSGEEDIYGSRVTPAGIVLDPAGIAISTAPHLQDRSSVGFDGTNYLVVWDDYRNYQAYHSDIYGARVTPSGNVLDPQGIVISETEGYQWSPRVAFGDTSYLVVWEDDLSGYDVYGARVATSGAVLDTSAACLSTSANDQCCSSIASDGTHYLVVWLNRGGSSGYDICGMRIDSAGLILDSMPIAISAAQNNMYPPAITFGNTYYLTVWIDALNGWITGKRISTDGTILDTSIVIGTQGRLPCVAFDGTNNFVVWEAYGIYGKRVSEAGVVVDTVAISISGQSPWNPSYPAVIFGDPYYFVVWLEEFYDECALHGARVATNGVVIDTTSILISTLCDDLSQPKIAFDAANYLVVWSYYNFYIYGARISPSGTVIDSPSVYIGPGYPSALVFNGSTYILLTERFFGNGSDVYGLIIDTSLAVVDSFVVCAQPGRQYSPALALNGGGRFLITYSGWTDSINAHPANTTRIWGTLFPFVGREEPGEFRINPLGLNLRIYPNPFNNMVNIQYCTRTEVDNIELKIYDISGRLVKDLFQLPSAVDHSTLITWDGTDQADRLLPSGIYFLQLRAGDTNITEKLLLTR